MLPTMIQMGICQSSCLEISNVTCKGRGEAARSIALLFRGSLGEPGAGPEHRRQLAPAGRSAFPSLGRCWREGWHSACRGLELPAPAQWTPDLSDQGDPTSSLRHFLPLVFFAASSSSPKLLNVDMSMISTLDLSFNYSHFLVSSGPTYTVGTGPGPTAVLGAHEHNLPPFKVRRKK